MPIVSLSFERICFAYWFFSSNIQHLYQYHKNYFQAQICAWHYYGKQKKEMTYQSKNYKPSTFHQLSNNQFGQANWDKAKNLFSGLKIYASISIQNKLAKIAGLYAK